MSDFVPRDILPDLWEEILQRHWTFLETEESMQKLEERKKLEGCLKEFLCIVPHDRKFFLPETSHVLKKSIKEMDDFSAYKAMIGLESISQYANNLFTKPWRKEYRIIKMYSGFYQHEIKSNLIDADKLFEAMGYKQLPNQILMLDGPICPDQVTNVSRDAMAAYVECQIMKQIFSGLTSMQLSCSWSDIFNFRETHIGGASQAVKSIAYAVQERRFRKEKLAAENCYATIQQTQQSCPSCVHTCHQQLQQIGNVCNHHPHIPQQQQPQQQQQYGGVCSLHPQQTQNIYMQNNIPIGHHYKQTSYGPQQMSHSKSLEHYGEHINSAGVLPHRHSFDQPYDNNSRGQQYDTGNYDCVDGYQSCNFNAYNHPYNVSGNRYPLPYNISNQLNNQFPGTCGNIPHYPLPPPPPPAIVNCGHKIQMNDPNCYTKLQTDQIYGDCNGYTKKSQDICNYHNMNLTNTNKDLMNYRQCNYIPNNRTNNVHTEQQLIDFDDRPNDIGIQCIPSTTLQQHPPSHQTRSLSNSFDINDRSSYDQNHINNRQYKQMKQLSLQQHYDIPRAHCITNNHLMPKDLYNTRNNIENSNEIDCNYIYSNSNGRNYEKNSTTTSSKGTITTKKLLIDKYTRNAEILEQYEKQIDNNHHHEQNQSSQKSTQNSYDSYEDIIDNNGAINDCNDMKRTKLITNKNQDGVGSFESWDYVFQNLEKHGYNKDLGERGDLLVRGLDLDSMNLTNNSDKRRSRNLDTKLRSTIHNNDSNNKMKILEKNDLTKIPAATTTTTTTAAAATSTTATSTTATTSTSTDINNIKSIKDKSILKHDNETVQKTITKTTQVQKSMQQSLVQNKIKNNSKNLDKPIIIVNSNNDDNNINKLSNGQIRHQHQNRSLNDNNKSTTNGIINNHQRSSIKSNSIKDTKIPATIIASTSTTSTSTSTSTTPNNIGTTPNEWSCRFCTYLNPDTKRICDMCCRSKDFNLDTSNAPTCV